MIKILPTKETENFLRQKIIKTEKSELKTVFDWRKQQPVTKSDAEQVLHC